MSEVDFINHYRHKLVDIVIIASIGNRETKQSLSNFWHGTSLSLRVSNSWWIHLFSAYCWIASSRHGNGDYSSLFLGQVTNFNLSSFDVLSCIIKLRLFKLMLKNIRLHLMFFIHNLVIDYPVVINWILLIFKIFLQQNATKEDPLQDLLEWMSLEYMLN